MRLALRELRRRPGRFVSAAAILSLIALLLMFLGGLLDGLVRGATGAVRSQDADVLVFSDGSQASFLRSRIEPTTAQELASVVDGEIGGLGVVLLGARVPGNGPRDLASVAVWGYELPTDDLPPPPTDGQAYADRILEAEGVEIGQTLAVGPARQPIEIIGWVEDTAYNGQGGLWTNLATWRVVLGASRPGATLGPDVVQALVVRDARPSDLPERLRNSTAEPVLVLDESAAIAAIPGVTEQRSTFNQILGVTVTVALVVIALFFALLTVERTALYGVLKAIGARSGTIFGGVVVQAVAVTAVAAIIGAAAVTLVSAAIPPGSIPLYVSTGRIVTSVVLLLVAAVAGSALSLRRVLRIDPASALGTSS